MMMENNTQNTFKKKAALHTLGCRLNSAETAQITQGFAQRGYEIVPFGQPADVVVVNTCTVTDQADSTCRNLIRKAKKSSPEGRVAVVGCYAQMEPEAISNIEGVDLILGTNEKYKIFNYLDSETELSVHVDLNKSFFGASTTPEDNHTRAFLKIQDGCNYICSFCIIPQARGRSRAISSVEAVKNAKSLVSNGFKEIVLTGVNVGEYSNTSNESFEELVQRLLEIDGLERLRLSSVEPNTVSRELLEILASSPKAMDHFHLPLQSGNDEILKFMRRKYSVDEYREKIAMVKDYFPYSGIGADIITGFPGETDSHFEDTMNLLRELPITHFHPFPYSVRKNTLAAKMDCHVHPKFKKQRMQSLIGLGQAKLNYFSEQQVSSISDVLFERRNKLGQWEGYTTNYVKVKVESKLDLKNTIKEVELTSFSDGNLIGKLS
jgi:threonylcarbamoyladenosine tRNA methylthiotransferase MtaB